MVRVEPHTTEERPNRLRRALPMLGAAALFGALGTFCFAPYGQFYLAWVWLAPLMFIAANATSWKTAAAGGYVAGLLFFLGNLWYIAYLGVGPLAGLVAYLAAYPALFALIWRPWARRNTLAAAVVAAAVWTGLEWLRGMAFTGLPYVLIGHSQSPLVHGIQVADVLGAYGVTFWVSLCGATAWAVFRHRIQLYKALPTLGLTAIVLAGVFGYGFYRVSEYEPIKGPRVMLLQPDFPLRNDAPLDELAFVQWHLDETFKTLREHDDVDLIVWPESVAPPLNPEARRAFSGTGLLREQLIIETHQRLRIMSRDRAIIVGGGLGRDYETRVAANGVEYPHPGFRQNAAFLYNDGDQSSETYAKRHLIPFGEFMPFRTHGPPLGWLYNVFALFHPWGEDWQLDAGDRDVAFFFGEFRAITPICFEDLLGNRVREMAYGDGGAKRADLIVNLTNDGWFRGPQMAQHLQAASFRSVETRLPTARAVNTGVSAVVDPLGRVVEALPAGETGVLVADVPLDGRWSPYGVVGDGFAVLCFVATITLACASAVVALLARFRP